MQRRSFFGAIAGAIGLGSVKATEAEPAKALDMRGWDMVSYDPSTQNFIVLIASEDIKAHSVVYWGPDGKATTSKPEWNPLP